MPDCGVHYLWFAFVFVLMRSPPPLPMHPWERLGRRLEEVVKAVGGGYCRLENAIEVGSCRHGDSGWAQAGRPGAPPPPVPMYVTDYGVHYLWFAFVCCFNSVTPPPPPAPAPG